jgi:hypothetical protein
METNGPIGAAEASAALATVRGSRARVAWAGYPAWYWLATGAALALLPFGTWLPDWAILVLVAGIVVAIAWLAVAVNRARGVCEYWTRSAVRWRDGFLLYGPALVVLLVGCFGERFAWWLPIPAAVLVFGLFAGTGLALTTRAATR